MKKNLFVFTVLVLLLAGVSAHAVVINEGTLQVVFPELRMVTIDHQKYKLMMDARVYRHDVVVPLSTALEGQRVFYDLYFPEGQPPMVKSLFIQDE